MHVDQPWQPEPLPERTHFGGLAVFITLITPITLMTLNVHTEPHS
ncbi:hypothetical protein ABZT04_33800 [Streptomyces sp. NPDC005492]